MALLILIILCDFSSYLHNVVCVGKRALAYAIAKRMASINSLDLKDCDGMVQYRIVMYKLMLILCICIDIF